MEADQRHIKRLAERLYTGITRQLQVSVGAAGVAGWGLWVMVGGSGWWEGGWKGGWVQRGA